MFMRIFLSLVLVLGLASMAIAQDFATTINSASQKIREGNFVEASVELDEALKLAMTGKEKAYVQRGFAEIQYFQGYWEIAKVEYAKVLGIEGAHAHTRGEAKYQIAQADVHLGNYAVARAGFVEVQGMKEIQKQYSSGSYLMEGECYLGEGNKVEAQKIFSNLLLGDILLIPNHIVVTCQNLDKADLELYIRCLIHSVDKLNVERDKNISQLEAVISLIAAEIGVDEVDMMSLRARYKEKFGKEYK